MHDEIPSMLLAGYDSNFENLGSSIRISLPSGGRATVGKTPVAKCFTDDELAAELRRRHPARGVGSLQLLTDNELRAEWLRRYPDAGILRAALWSDEE